MYSYTFCRETKKQNQNSPCYLYIGAIPRPDSSPPSQKLAGFIGPQDAAGDDYQADPVKEAQRLGLEDPLQKRHVDDGGLAQQAAADGEVEHSVVKHADLAAEHALALGPAGEGVEHVKQDEAGKGHGGVAGGDDAAVGHFVYICGEGADHDDGGRLEDATDEGGG
jgi:hypothetical protein